MSSRLLFKQFDISDRSAIHDYLREIRERFGTVHVLVNNAGVALDGVLALQTDVAIDQMIDINLKGTIALTKACDP